MIVSFSLFLLSPVVPNVLLSFNAGDVLVGIAVLGSFVFFFVFIVSILAGIVSFTLNIPLLLKTFRERAKLKELGLSSLSLSLWKESRRGRWIRRARSGVLIVTAVFSSIIALLFFVVPMLPGDKDAHDAWESVKELAAGFVIGSAPLVVAGWLLAARYLRNHRERMEQAASAEELRKALQSLQQRKKSGVVSVPAEFLEKTAKIESLQIAKQRKDAILESVASPSKEYAVAFDHEAAERRTTLSVADRVELEDLVEELSTDGAKLESQLGTVVGAKDAMLRAATKSKRVEIDYLIDPASHRIRITAVRRGVSSSQASTSGASHA